MWPFISEGLWCGCYSVRRLLIFILIPEAAVNVYSVILAKLGLCFPEFSSPRSSDLVGAPVDILCKIWNVK